MADLVQLPIPEALAKLPVARQAHSIDFRARGNLLFMAETGSGKTLVLPALEATLGAKPGPILLRQPTRTTVEAVHRSLRKFWPGLQVGISTSQRKEDLDGADIIVFSDGSLRGLLARGDPPAALYPDEVHLLSTHHEIELAVALHRGIPIRAMSATVDPVPLAAYLGHADIHKLDGRTHPVIQDTVVASDAVFDRRDTFQLAGHIADFCEMLADQGERGIVFLPTKDLCERMAAEAPIEATHLHGDVDPAAVLDWTAARPDSPWAVFSTTAGATGVTLDVGHVLIRDPAIASSMERGIETVHRQPLSDNMLLQMRGRAGRLRPGTATLLTARGSRPVPPDRDPGTWLSTRLDGPVRPRPIDAPCARTTPYDVRVQMAAMGVPWTEAGALLSAIKDDEMQHAESWLRRYAILGPDNSLTAMGRNVASFPLSAKYAHLVLSAPSDDLKLALLAALSLGLGGTYGLVSTKPDALVAKRRDNPLFEVWPRDCVVWGSVPLTLAKTLGALANAENPESVDEAWLESRNLRAVPFRQAIRDYLRAAERISDSPVHDLATADFEALREPLWDHLSRSDLFSRRTIRQGQAWPRQPFSPFDAVFSDSFGLADIDRPIECLAIVRRQKTRTGGLFFPLDMGHFHPEARP